MDEAASPPARGGRSSWAAITHDWRRELDETHLEVVQGAPGLYAPGGAWHLVLEVLAYAADEADSAGRGTARVTVGPGSRFTVADQGRGTDTRTDQHGETVKKPIMATRDLRFFDGPPRAVLPDGHPRRGISVVAALSTSLEHTNRRREGSWTQSYRHGRPATGLVPIADDATTGTTVTFQPAPPVGVDLPATTVMHGHLAALNPRLEVTLDLDHQHGDDQHYS